MVHVGVDLHKRYAQVSVLEASGEVKEFTLPTEAERVREVFEAMAVPAWVAVEAQGSWYWFVDLLQQLGHKEGLGWLSQVPLSEGAGWLRDDGLRVLALLDEQIGRLDQEVRRRAEESPVARLFTTLPVFRSLYATSRSRR